MADNWIQKLKMAATKHIAEKYHSPAGRKHLKQKKTQKQNNKQKQKEIKATRLSKHSKKQLEYLPDEDYKLVMKALKGEK